MDLIKNWKLHLLAVLIVCVAEWIGMQKFGLVVLLPLLYALVLGGIVSLQVHREQMQALPTLERKTMLY